MSSRAISAQAAASTHPRADKGLFVCGSSPIKLAGGALASPASFGAESNSSFIFTPLITALGPRVKKDTDGTKSPHEFFSCIGYYVTLTAVVL